MRVVSCDMLTSDMILAKSVYKGDKTYLVKGQGDLLKYVGSLRRLGIDYLYVNDNDSDGIEIPDVVTEKTRQKCREVVMNTLERYSRDSIVSADELIEPMRELLNEVLSNKDIQISLLDIRATDDYTFAHSVSATVYAMLIGRELGYDRYNLEKLSIGLLLHDIGKTLIRREVLFKEGPLNYDEFEYVKTHTTLGYNALIKCNSISRQSKLIALTHHERIDGSGYPYGLKDDEIDEFSRIAAVADTYDALTSDRCYREKWSAQNAVNFLIKNSGTHFDTEIVSKFIQNIAIYPNGSMVVLSNGCSGLVKQQNKNMPLRPLVRVIYDSFGSHIKHPYELDLMKNLNIVISESQTEIINKHLIYADTN